MRYSRRNRWDEIKEWEKIHKLKLKRSLEPAGIGNCSPASPYGKWQNYCTETLLPISYMLNQKPLDVLHSAVTSENTRRPEVPGNAS